MLIDKAGAKAKVVLREHDPNIIEVVWNGEIGVQDMEYLQRLSQMVRHGSRRHALLYDLRNMARFEPPVVGVHAGFSNEHRPCLEKIAVVSNLTSVRFAIRTVSLWQRAPIEGFTSRALAMTWLRS